MTRPLSLAHLTFLDLPPPALVRVAAAAGFAAVGLRLIAVTPTTPGYALMDDPKMMRETRAALRDTGVTVNDIEFLRFTPDFQADQFDAFLSVGAELGAKYIVTAPYDPDLGRLSDNLARFADRAAGFGLAPVLEFFPWTNVADLQAALEIVTNTGTASAGVLLDTLHFDRSGSQLGDISRADPSRLPFIHLCDALVKPSYSEEELLHTAREARLIPGHGQIGLTDILERLPRDTGIGVEIPASAVPESGSETARAREIFLGTHKFLGRTALA